MVSKAKVWGSAIMLCSMLLIVCSGASVESPGAAPLSLDVGERPRGISVGDLAGDGRPDIAVANADSDTLTVLLQTAVSGAFVRQDYPAGSEPSDIELGDFDRAGYAQVPGRPVQVDTPTEVAAGDVDGDGLHEIAVGLWGDDHIYLLRPNGTSMGNVAACFRPAAIAMADLDRDGRAELIAGCWNEGKILVFDGRTIFHGG